MLSRVAENLYWMGRYVERATNIARLLEVNYHLSLDIDSEYVQWEPLIAITGDLQYFVQNGGRFEDQSVMNFLILDAEYINSGFSSICMARENARGTRENLPLKFWEELNQLYHKLNNAYQRGAHSASQIFSLCQDIKDTGVHLQGICEDSMWHGEGYYFYKMGLWIERADKTSRFLHAKYFYLLPKIEDVGSALDDIHWTALLQSLHGIDIFYRHYGLITPEKVIQFLVLDTKFPRSILFCLQHTLGCIQSIYTMHNSQLSNSQFAPLVQYIQSQAPIDIIQQGLHEFIDNFQIRLNEAAQTIQADFFNQTIHHGPSQNQQ
jgi:uncharacterized alpha-E superfamily protein